MLQWLEKFLSIVDNRISTGREGKRWEHQNSKQCLSMENVYDVCKWDSQ